MEDHQFTVGLEQDGTPMYAAKLPRCPLCGEWPSQHAMTCIEHPIGRILADHEARLRALETDQ